MNVSVNIGDVDVPSEYFQKLISDANIQEPIPTKDPPISETDCRFTFRMFVFVEFSFLCFTQLLLLFWYYLFYPQQINSSVFSIFTNI